MCRRRDRVVSDQSQSRQKRVRGSLASLGPHRRGNDHRPRPSVSRGAQAALFTTLYFSPSTNRPIGQPADGRTNRQTNGRTGRSAGHRVWARKLNRALAFRDDLDRQKACRANKSSRHRRLRFQWWISWHRFVLRKSCRALPAG